jgi:carbamoyl-phosphate synthase large subunit
MPKMFKDIALHGEFPDIDKRINPLPDGLVWLRGMDTKPKLMHESEIMNDLINL